MFLLRVKNQGRHVFCSILEVEVISVFSMYSTRPSRYTTCMRSTDLVYALRMRLHELHDLERLRCITRDAYRV